MPRTCSAAPTGKEDSRRGSTRTSSCSMSPTGATSPTTSAARWLRRRLSVGVSIREAQPAELDAVRALIEEYVRSLGIDLSFQEVDEELADLATAYGPPGGCILVGLAGGEVAGCVALRPLEDQRCEMKRLY